MSHLQLGATVWPPYIGLSVGDPGPAGTVAAHEPYDDAIYARGMIHWRTENGGVVGGAKIFAPKGIYTHIVFFSGPHHVHPLMGAVPLEHPLVFDLPGVVEIDPIRNDEYLPRG
jgi:hypothetical protein